jgi:selenophosphate synthase
MKSVKWEEALPDEKERLLAEAQGLLVAVEEVHLRNIKAIVKDAQRDVSKAYELVHRLEGLLKAGKRKK